MDLKNEEGYLLLTVLYILLFVTLVLSLATYIMSNQLTYAKDTVKAYQVRAALNLVARSIQEELDQGREVVAGQIRLSSGTATVNQIEKGLYELHFSGEHLPDMTQEKVLNTQVTDRLVSDYEKKEEEIKKEEATKEEERNIKTATKEEGDSRADETIDDSPMMPPPDEDRE